MSAIRVILADDHAVVRAGIADTLRGFPNLSIVGEVGDGVALFEALATHQPDVLLIDVSMPQFDPLSAVHRIRTQYPTLKILVVSAYDDDVYVQGLLGVGVHGYHLKDQPLSDLHLALECILAGERWVCGPLIQRLERHRGGAYAATLLTTRQRDLLLCLQQGLDNQTIARQTGLSVKTVENHLTRLYRQLNVQSRLEAVNYILQRPEILSHTEIRPHPSQADAHPMPSQWLKLLLVDDNLRYRTQLRRMIGKAFPHALIHEAENIQVALSVAETHHPQLAFVDVVLGDENGIDCTRFIKERSPTTRIVLISAYPDREFHRQGLKAGAAAFLDKRDLTAAALREIINDMAA